MRIVKEDHEILFVKRDLEAAEILFKISKFLEIPVRFRLNVQEAEDLVKVLTDYIVEIDSHHLDKLNLVRNGKITC